MKIEFTIDCDCFVATIRNKDFGGNIQALGRQDKWRNDETTNVCDALGYECNNRHFNIYGFGVDCICKTIYFKSADDARKALSLIRNFQDDPFIYIPTDDEVTIMPFDEFFNVFSKEHHCFPSFPHITEIKRMG
jgi:hypothetical protein